MNADDLLRRTLRYLQKTDSINALAEDIEKYLGQPKDEPVAWMWNALMDGEVITQYGPYVPKLFEKSAVPLYLHPPTKTAPKDEPELFNEEIEKAMVELHTTHAVIPKIVYQIEVNADLVSAIRHSISGYFDDAYVYGDELLSKILEDIKNHPPTKTAPKEPMTEEEIDGYLSKECLGEFNEQIFKWGVDFAERHHGITGEEANTNQIDMQSRCRGDKE